MSIIIIENNSTFSDSMVLQQLVHVVRDKANMELVQQRRGEHFVAPEPLSVLMYDISYKFTDGIMEIVAWDKEEA